MAFLALIFLCGLSGFAAAAQVKLIITNDVHGHVAADPGAGRIGYALLKSYADAARKSGWTVYLLDSGDVFSGNAYAQADHGRSIAQLLAMLGYRVLAPGNHAFDHNEVEKDPLYYSNVLLKTVKDASAGPLTAVSMNLSRHGLPLPEMQREPVIIHDETASGAEAAGTRIIVAGVITPYTVRRSLRDSVPDYDFGQLESPEDTKRKILDDLAASLAPFDRPEDVVVVLAHLGYAGPDGDRDGRITGPDLVAVANVDFIADGHTHTAIRPRQAGGAVYGNGGRYLEHFLEIDVDAEGARMELKSFGDLAGLRPDAAVESCIADMDRRQGLSEILFTLPGTGDFGDENLRTDSVPLGRLICRAMQQATGADFALHNIGGIRAGLPDGPVSARALYDTLPFGDDLVVVTLTGRELLDIFDRGSGHGGRGFPQFHGFRVYASREAGGRLKPAGFIGLDGRPVDLDARYTVAMNSIMAKAMPVPTENRGELIQVLKRELPRNIEQRVAEALADGLVLIFGDAEEAQREWEKAAMDYPCFGIIVPIPGFPFSFPSI